MTDPTRRWLQFFPQRRLPIVAAFFAGFMAGFFAVAMQEHHGLPWASVIVSAPVDILARLIFDPGEVYLWSKIVGTAVLYALYAYVLTDRRIAGGWKYVFGIHGACVILVALMPAH